MNEWALAVLMRKRQFASFKAYEWKMQGLTIDNIKTFPGETYGRKKNVGLFPELYLNVYNLHSVLQLSCE